MTIEPLIRFRLDHFDAELPSYTTAGAAGADIRSVEAVVIAPGETRIVATGLLCDIPEGFELQVRPRSGLAAKNSITVLNAPGTIDSDYQGEIKVILHNASRVPFKVSIGDRIAQVVVAPVLQARFVRIEPADAAQRRTDRGTGGFGSTGVA